MSFSKSLWTAKTLHCLVWSTDDELSVYIVDRCRRCIIAGNNLAWEIQPGAFLQCIAPRTTRPTAFICVDRWRSFPRRAFSAARRRRYPWSGSSYCPISVDTTSCGQVLDLIQKASMPLDVPICSGRAHTGHLGKFKVCLVSHQCAQRYMRWMQSHERHRWNQEIWRNTGY